MRQVMNGERTLFFDEETHVATMWSNGKDCVHWITKDQSGREVGANALRQAIAKITEHVEASKKEEKSDLSDLFDLFKKAAKQREAANETP